MYRFACAAPNCRMRTYNFSREQSKLAKSNYVVSFHKFPSDPEKREAWIKTAKKSNWNPTEESCLCSLHFKDDSFNENNQLFDNAVPTIFFDDFRGYIKDLIKNINLEVELESDSSDNDDILQKSLKGINTEILDDSEEIVELEVAVSDDDFEIECEEVVLSESEGINDGSLPTPGSNSSTTAATPAKSAIPNKTDKSPEKSSKLKKETVVSHSQGDNASKVPVPQKQPTPARIVRKGDSSKPATTKTTPTIGVTSIKTNELPSEPSETAKKLFSMIQTGSFKKFTVMQPASRSLVCQLLNIVRLANAQNAQSGTESSVPNTYIITTKQENEGSEEKKNIVLMETSEIVSMITRTVQSIKDGVFKKSDDISIICGSPAIFLIKNVIVKNFDRNMNSVYVITTENLLPYLFQLSTKVAKKVEKLPPSSTTSTPTSSQTPVTTSTAMAKITSANSQTPSSTDQRVQTKTGYSKIQPVSTTASPTLETNTKFPTAQNSLPKLANSLPNIQKDVPKIASTGSNTSTKALLTQPVITASTSSTSVLNNTVNLPGINEMRQKFTLKAGPLSRQAAFLQAVNLNETSALVPQTPSGEQNQVPSNLAAPVTLASIPTPNTVRQGVRNKKQIPVRPSNSPASVATPVFTLDDSPPRDVPSNSDAVAQKRKLDATENRNTADSSIPERKRILDATYLQNQKNEIQVLEKNILRKEREIISYKKKIQLLKRRYITVKNPCDTKSDEQFVEEILKKYLDQDAVQFFVGQMKVSGKTYTQFRWSEEDKLFALGLLYKNPVEYHILFQKFTLPSDKTLSKFVSKVKKAEQAAT